MTLDDAAVGAGDRFDLPVDRARHQPVGEAIARDECGGAPAEREGGPGGALTKGVGGGHRQAGDAAGALDGVALRDGGQEDALAIGGPAVVAQSAAGGVGGGEKGCGEKRGGFAIGGPSRGILGVDAGGDLAPLLLERRAAIGRGKGGSVRVVGHAVGPRSVSRTGQVCEVGGCRTALFRADLVRRRLTVAASTMCR